MEMPQGGYIALPEAVTAAGVSAVQLDDRSEPVQPPEIWYVDIDSYGTTQINVEYEAGHLTKREYEEVDFRITARSRSATTGPKRTLSSTPSR
jgi:hypothetical protein